MTPEPLKPARQLKLLWPVAALALLLLFNLIFTRGFFRLEVTEGSYLSGSLIDMVKNGSIVMLLSLGMTLVIATGGVDLSVGARNGHCRCGCGDHCEPAGRQFYGGGYRGRWRIALGRRVERPVGRGVSNSADRGDAHIDGRRSRRGAADHRRADHHVSRSAAHVYLCNGHFLGAPFPVWIVACMLFLTAFWTRKTAWGLFIECVGDNEQAATYARHQQSRREIRRVYVFRPMCRAGGTFGGVEYQRGRFRPCRTVSGTRCHCGRGGRRDGPGRWAILSNGIDRRSADHSGAHHHDVCAGGQFRCRAGS